MGRKGNAHFSGIISGAKVGIGKKIGIGDVLTSEICGNALDHHCELVASISALLLCFRHIGVQYHHWSWDRLCCYPDRIYCRAGIHSSFNVSRNHYLFGVKIHKGLIAMRIWSDVSMLPIASCREYIIVLIFLDSQLGVSPNFQTISFHLILVDFHKTERTKRISHHPLGRVSIRKGCSISIHILH